VLGDKRALAASALDGQGNLGSLARLPQPCGSMFASFLRDDAYGQGCKGYSYSRCHFRFDRQIHMPTGSLTRPMVDSSGMCFKEIFRPSSLHPPSKLNEAMLCASNGSCFRRA